MINFLGERKELGEEEEDFSLPIRFREWKWLRTRP